MKKALICGVSGQDGAYLSKLLLEKGYKVFGGSRDASANRFENLDRLGIKEDLEFVSINLSDFRSVLQTIIKTAPDEIYNLSGQSSVGLSFDQPVETFESISIGTLNLLEAIRFSSLDIKLYNSGSSECFGEAGDAPANERTPFKPVSPYAVAKAAAHWQVTCYRKAYHLFACTGILFNHESPLRSDRFVTKKIVNAVYRISQGSNETLHLGNIDIMRDWGWAPDYVKAMWLMLQQAEPNDFVIATGITHPLRYFIQLAFEYYDLDWQQHVVIDQSLMRPSDLKEGRADISKSRAVLGWHASYKLEDIVKAMLDDLANQNDDKQIGNK